MQAPNIINNPKHNLDYDADTEDEITHIDSIDISYLDEDFDKKQSAKFGDIAIEAKEHLERLKADFGAQIQSEREYDEKPGN